MNLSVGEGEASRFLNYCLQRSVHTNSTQFATPPAKILNLVFVRVFFHKVSLKFEMATNFLDKQRWPIDLLSILLSSLAYPSL